MPFSLFPAFLHFWAVWLCLARYLESWKTSSTWHSQIHFVEALLCTQWSLASSSIPPSVPAGLCAVQWGLRWNELSWGQPVGDGKGQDAGREDVQQSIKELFCGNAFGQISLFLRKCQTRQRGDWKLSHYPGKKQQLHTCVPTSPALEAPGRATWAANHPVAWPHWPKDKNY